MALSHVSHTEKAMKGLALLLVDDDVGFKILL